MERQSQIPEIKAGLQSRLDALLAELGIEVRREHVQADHVTPLNPTRADKNAGSFVIWTRGEARGAYRDYACGDDCKGDVIDLVQYCLRIDTRGNTLKWCEDWLGLTPEARPDQARAHAQRLRQNRPPPAAARLNAEPADGRDLEGKRKSAHAIWLAGAEDLTGTPVERYLAGRGIDLAALARPPRAIRAHAALHHRPSRTQWPAMVAALTGADGRFVAVHRTWVTFDGRKADVTPQRMVWPGGLAGAAIRLARGGSGLSERQAAARGVRDVLVLCEGVEDGLSVALACPDYRVWAAYSLGNLAAVRVPDCAAEVVVFADNDWGKAEAEKALAKALAALSAQGRPVRVARSKIGKDANDCLRG